VYINVRGEVREKEGWFAAAARPLDSVGVYYCHRLKFQMGNGYVDEGSR
jgi:hypothetical protein